MSQQFLFPFLEWGIALNIIWGVAAIALAAKAMQSMGALRAAAAGLPGPPPAGPPGVIMGAAVARPPPQGVVMGTAMAQPAQPNSSIPMAQGVVMGTALPPGAAGANQNIAIVQATAVTAKAL